MTRIMKGTIFFDPGDAIYKVHFPSRPVVPGSLIVHAFLEAVGRGLPGRRFRVERFRFREFVTPGTYAFTLEASAGQFQCRLLGKGRILVTGWLSQDEEP